MKWLISITVYLLAELGRSTAFNLETENFTKFDGDSEWFGYNVRQMDSGNGKWVIVSAPLQGNGSLFRCSYNSSSCSRITVPGAVGPWSMGLALTTNPSTQELVVCGPRLQHPCGKNTYLNGICFKLNRTFMPLPGNYSPGYQECPPKNIDIVFLIDGSGSISSGDFSKMKTFMIQIIKNFHQKRANVRLVWTERKRERLTDCVLKTTDLPIAELLSFISTAKVNQQLSLQFAVVQFSSYTEVEFNFNTYLATSNIEILINNIVQKQQFTYTAKAIQFVANNMFLSSSGARPDAIPVLITITDGLATDPNDLPKATSEADKHGIVRYAIGVGDAFVNLNARNQLNIIASNSSFVFAVDNFDALSGLQNQLAEKIFAIEGKQSSTASSFVQEMSQGGFSTHFDSDGKLYFGAVGTYDWSGGYFQSSGDTMTFYNMSSDNTDMTNSYLGYSMTDLKVNISTYIVVGAPRYAHMGRVVVFQGNNVTQSVNGNQSGCYFGAAVCAVNLKGKTGTTKLVLVGAPMYISPDREGLVFVYRFDMTTMKLIASGALSGQSGQSSSRFGASIKEVQDLNGDGINDVAVGAPLEDNGHGSVYIFNGGEQDLGQYTQRIAASDLPVTLQYWGQSLHGTMDLSGDGIPELAVGSQGKVLVLRSRPVLRVEPTVSFDPPIISLDNKNCQSFKNFTATVCFPVSKATKDNIADLQVNISYTFTLDATRSVYRAYFSTGNRMINNTVTARVEVKCVKHQFKIPECPEDSLVSLSNELRFSVSGYPSLSTANLKPILDVSTQTDIFFPLDFERHCGTDDKCVDQLNVNFIFSGVSEVQVGISPVLNLNVSIENAGEDSYNTRIIFTFPNALSYRRSTLLQWDRVATVQCDVTGSNCLINRPIFKSQAKVLFITTFDVDASSKLDRVVTLSANATSGNEEHNTTNSFVQRTIPVRFAVNILVKKADESTNYINFTAGRNDLQKPVSHILQVQNLGIRYIPVNVTIRVPVKLGNTDIWSNSSGLKVPGCIEMTEMTVNPPVTDFLTKLKTIPLVDCSVAVCKVFSCTISTLSSPIITYNLTGEVSSAWIQQTDLQSLSLVSSASLSFDTQQYIHIFTTAQDRYINTEVETRVNVYVEYDYKKEIIGGVVGGLVLLALITLGLYKAGFFKRGYKELLKEAKTEGQNATPGEESALPVQE
ncbi:integrin alpha-X [Amia ocellicauda]|uniref:integrin alpha-X n=1 Tax=Amia ocellicauda TaxID=2972642 RepID=UPI003463BF8A